ncbi:MAG: single-stranded DNA-binding protein [Candidatus Hadarchaeum sp.]|uniref:single-stranded DNA-binding protein n=1 Tax=Candidatus Hadarchaeum sp. TaxID=2883567 RepID=UPI003D0D7463
MEPATESASAQTVKVKDLTPQSRRVNLVVKVIGVGEPKEIPGRFGGEPKKVADAQVGDETGTILLSLWQEQIGSVCEGDVLSIENGYVSLVQGHMRLNIGKYGKMTKTDQEMKEVNTEVDLSAAEHPRESRPFRPRRGGYQSRGRYGGSRRF